MQLTRHPAATPQNPGSKVAQDMVRFEVKEVMEVHRVMHRPEAIFSPGSSGWFLFRIAMGNGKMFLFQISKSNWTLN